MKNLFLTKTRWLVTILLSLGIGQMWGYTYTRLESIAGIDANAVYVLGIDGTGFHYSGTSSWGLTALPANQTPYYYTLTPNNNNTSFTAQTKISNTTYYLQVPTSNTFSMSTSAGTNTTLIIGTTQSNAGNDKGYAVANSGTTTRHLRRNGSNGLRSYAGNTGSLAFFYKVCCPNPTSLTNGEITSNTAHLSWTDAANTNKYEVYISTGSIAPGSDATPTATVTDQKYADITSGLSTSTTYNWWVRAKDKNNSAITSDWVAGTAFTTTSGASCAVDPTVSASSNGSVTCTSATITCNNGSSKGVVKGSCDISEWGFVYGTSSSPTGNKTSVGTNSSTDVANFSHTFTGLTPGQTYYFRAYAIVNGTTYYGSQTNFTCKTITVTANNGSYGSVSGSGLSWTATPNSGYVFADPAYTITAGNNTSVNKVGNTFTITSTSTVNVTITINFEAKNCTEHNSAALIAGTESSYTYGPVDPYYKYSTRQILYTKTDMNLGSTKKGSIKSIYFQYNHSTAISVKDDVKIYMANTNLTSLSKDDYVPYSAFTEVYSGAMNCTNGWNEITLNTPYEYNGVGSLVVMIDDNSGECHTTAFVFKYHSATGSQIYTYSDSNNENPETTDWSDYTPTNNRPNTKFCIEEKDMTISTVSFNTGTGNPTQANIAETSAGGGIALPAGPTPKCSADGWSFAGWSESAVASETTTAPTLLSAGSTYHPVSNTTLYAVYVKSEVAATATTTTYTLTGNWTTDNGNWTKIDGTDLSALASGKWGINSGSSTAVSPTSWTDIEKIDFTGSKSSSGSGTVEFLYGSGNSWTSISSQAVANSISWSPNPKVTGQLKCVFTRTNGNIYIASIAVKGKATVNTYFSNPECCNTLAAPANPGETPNSTGAVLTWDAVSGATGYEVKIDDGEWTSTGNGTTTGYTITGKACGGTSVSWKVRATGDGTTNCAKGAATAVQNFSTTSCACTATYSFHWYNESTWHPTGGDANICFHDTGDKGDNTESTYYITDEFAIPVASMYKVGWEGSDHWDNARTAQWGFQDMPYELISGNPTFGNVPHVGYIAGALGYIRIRPWYTGTSDADKNKHPGFIPSAYTLQIGTGADNEDWSNSETLVLSKQDPSASYYAQYWQTEMVTLTSDRFLTKRYWVGLKTSSGYVWCGRSQKGNIVSNMPIKTGADTWGSGVQNSHAGQKGRFVLDAYNNAMNWNVRFVPYWEASYDANGGGAVSTTATNVGPVSCEGDATARQVTMPAAPSYEHHEFDGWLSSVDAQTYAAAATVSLTQNTTFTAQWHNASYNISATLTNVTSGTSFPVAYTYTGSAANVTYTFAASSGYRLPDAVTVTGSTYTWNQASGQLTLTGIITGDVTITISGTQTHTVTWKYNGSDYVSPVTYDHGASLVLPTPNPTAPSGCSSKVFVGWTARNSEIDTETSTKPTLINPASPGTVTGDVTYHAVFADEVTSTTTVIRYLYTTSISTGKNYIIASSNSAGSVNTATYTGTGNAFTNTSMTVVSGTPNYIAAPANNNAVWSVAAGSASGKYYIQNVGNAGNYIRINGSAANISTDQTDVYFDSDHGVFGKSGSGSTSYSFYYSSGWVKGTFSTSNRNYIFVATEVEVETTTTDKYITLCSTCTTPSNVTAGNISSTGATISWDGVSIEEQTGGSGTGFVVKYGTNAIRDNNNNTVTATSSESSKALTGLTPATQYYAWVQSKCDNSWSETPASFHTAAKITYDKNGGTGTNTSEDVTYNSNVTIKTIATLGFEAPSGKTFNGWLASSAVTVGGSSTTSVADGATISNLTAAITLTAQWRDLAQYHVTFSANNGTVAGGASQTVTEGGTLTFPNVTPTCGAFVGWIESSSYSSSTMPSGATFHLADDEIAVTAALDDKTYYAVYAEATDPEPTEDYVLIENEQNDWSGDYLIVVSYDDSGTPRNRAMDGSLATLDATSNYQDVIISSKTITSNATTDGYKFTIAKVAGQPGKYSIQSAHGEYMGSNGDNTASKPNEIDQSSTLTADLYNTISYNSTESRPEILGSNANPLVLTYNKASGQTRFRYMTAVSTAIQIYKKGGGSVYTYKTSPSCTATVSTSTPASSFTYVYGNGPSESQTFQVSGSNLSANLVVTAPSNYEVSADNSSFSNSINIAPSGDGRVATTTVYIHLAAGLNVGTYSGGVITVSSTGADNDVSGTLTGSVTKATGTFTWTDFNAVDHYEGELTGASVAIPYNYTYVGDGTVNLVKVGNYGTIQTDAKTYTLTAVGEFQLRAEVSGGVNYTNPANTLATFIVYKADRFYDNIHADVQELVSITLPIVERGSYVAPDLMDADKGSANCAAKHYKFMGWVSEANITAGLPNDDAYKAVLIPAGTPMTATGTNYYAVWAEDE